MTDSDRIPVLAQLAGRWTRLKAALGDSEQLLTQRLAGTVFLIRVFSAALAFGSQVLFARWMGSFEFGIYVYVWTWVMLIGAALDLGLGSAAQRFIPEYRERQALAHLRGFLAGSRWFVLAMSIVFAFIGALIVHLLRPFLNDYTVIPLYLACASLPAFALAKAQDGISRSYDWVGLALGPTFIVRQLVLIAMMAAAYGAGLPMDAITATTVAGLSMWVTTFGQMLVLNRRLKQRTATGARTYDFKTWLATALPILLVEGFYLLLAYTDILVLEQFRSPDEVAIYYAAVKTLALVSFVHFSIAATTAHRFSEYHVTGDREGLARFLARSIRWTFWPSLIATVVLLALGKPMLWLFGSQFTSGYYLMFILAAGLLARAAVGPIERLLNMLGEQRACALVYGVAFALNLGLCFLLIPFFGATGAAVATALAIIVESLMLFFATRWRLGLHVFIWRGRAET